MCDMKIFKILLCFVFCLAPLISHSEEYLYDHSSCSVLDVLEDNEEVPGKIYIQPEQIFISHDGIFIFDNVGWARVHQLNCDEIGIYYFSEKLDKITDKCPNGHKIWCGRCGVCVTRWCKFRCKCVEWE